MITTNDNVQITGIWEQNGKYWIVADANNSFNDEVIYTENYEVEHELMVDEDDLTNNICPDCDEADCRQCEFYQDVTYQEVKINRILLRQWENQEVIENDFRYDDEMYTLRSYLDAKASSEAIQALIHEFDHWNSVAD